MNDKEKSIYDSHVESNIDGFGDEGAGYSYSEFAAQLESRGWVYRPKVLDAVDSIILDLRDRAGLGGEWDSIDEDIQKDIRMEWAGILRGVL